MSDSETEPESDVPSSPEKACPLDPADVSTTMITSKTHSSESDPINAVNSAVKILESLDFSLIRKDESLHGTIQESSRSLLEFLHVVLTMSSTSVHDVRRMMESLAHLRSATVLPKSIIPVPALFHALAVQELKKVTVIPIIISWVDAVLAKLGDVVSCVASAMHDRCFDDELPEALRKRREEDNLRAAAQLPDRWDSVPSVLTSAKASPAAKRLALRLLVSRYILQPQLVLHPRVADAPLDDMSDQYRQYGITAPLSHRLYAAHCGATLRVLSPTRTTPIWVSRAHKFADYYIALPDLDAPRIILILWRHFVPWTWRLLAECNGSDSETIIFLTTTWLHCASDSDPRIITSTPATFTGDKHGKYMICAYLAYFSRLLVYLSSAPRPQNLTTAQMDVLLKTSSDYVTHAMARMQPRSLRDGWKQAIQESSTFYDELEKSITNTRMQAFHQLEYFWLTYVSIGSYSRTNLTRIIFISNQKLIIEFLEATIEYLRRESGEKQLPNLSTSFLSCLTAFQRGQPGIKICDAPLLLDTESIWRVAMDNTTPELALASAFALHIMLSRRLPGSLTQVEAWDYLRNVLLMIGSQDYLGDESPLALIVNPTICDALSLLLRHADEHAANPKFRRLSQLGQLLIVAEEENFKARDRFDEPGSGYTGN
ncbi:hypothetical protein BDR07DRAFT_1372319 [Suillus spraguei]|nr:hypothetical protein BDR07DRAFT_1372319 [Suillus spraguei]